MTRLARIFCAASALILSACRADLVPVMPEGALQVSIGNISSSVVETKAAPAEIAKPAESDFSLRIVNNGKGNTLYNGRFTSTPIKALPGDYTVSVQAGEDVELAYDSPFYSGSATASVYENAMIPTPVNVLCKVSNSLISVVFGENALERSRFSALFEECEMIVDIGSKKIGIDMPGQSRSVYLRAGQDFTLSFRGTLRNDPDHTVFAYLNAEGLPSSLGTADHLIITLNPSHESGAGVEISKIDLVEAELGSTIPFSWLPVPKVSAQHVFDQEGTLLGTKLETTESYPGCEWTANVYNSSDILVRSITGTGSLSSDYSDSDEWPYLPAGAYYATFSYNCNGALMEIKDKRREFAIDGPEQMKVTASYETSYTRYLKNDISGANACNGTTIYNVRAELKISDDIKNKTQYGSLISSVSLKGWIDSNLGDAYTQNISSYSHTMDTGSVGNHRYNFQFVFDGRQNNQSFDFTVTGIPYGFNFRTGETCTTDGVRNFGWTPNGKTGKAPTTDEFYTCSGSESGYVVSPKFAVPSGIINVKAEMIYKFYVPTTSPSQVMTVYTQPVNNINAKATQNAQSVSASNSTSANSGRRNIYVDITLTPDNSYVSLANDGTYGGLFNASYLYLHEFGLSYR